MHNISILDFTWIISDLIYKVHVTSYGVFLRSFPRQVLKFYLLMSVKHVVKL